MPPIELAPATAKAPEPMPRPAPEPQRTNTFTASGWVVPKTDPYQKPDGTTCRDVTQSVSKQGRRRARTSRSAARKWRRPMDPTG